MILCVPLIGLLLVTSARSETTDPSLLDRVQEVLRAHTGTCAVFFCFMYPDGKLVFLEANQHLSVVPTEELIEQLEAILGEETVWLKVDTDKMANGGNGGRRGPWDRRGARGKE